MQWISYNYRSICTAMSKNYGNRGSDMQQWYGRILILPRSMKALTKDGRFLRERGISGQRDCLRIILSVYSWL